MISLFAKRFIFLSIFRMAPCKLTAKRARAEASGSTSTQGRQTQIPGPMSKKIYLKFEQLKFWLKREQIIQKFMRTSLLDIYCNMWVQKIIHGTSIYHCTKKSSRNSM